MRTGQIPEPLGKPTEPGHPWPWTQYGQLRTKTSGLLDPWLGTGHQVKAGATQEATVPSSPRCLGCCSG